MSSKDKIIDPLLSTELQKPTQRGTEQKFYRVIFRCNESAVKGIWHELSSKAPLSQQSLERKDFLNNLNIADIVDAITLSNHDIPFKNAFNLNLVNAMKFSQLDDQPDHVRIKNNEEVLKKYYVPQTIKLNLVDSIVTDLPENPLRAMIKMFEDDPRLAQKLGIEYIELNKEYSLPKPPKTPGNLAARSLPGFMPEKDDPPIQMQVNPDVWPSSPGQGGYDGSGIDVAVLDSGVDMTHEDLQGKDLFSKDFTIDIISPSDHDQVTDSTSHGTHVASTIAGSGTGSGTGSGSDRNFRGIAYNSKLIVAKVLGSGGSGSMDRIEKAFEWAIEKGADIINLSLGAPAPTDGSDTLSQAIEKAVINKGVIVCVAAGNEGTYYDENTWEPVPGKHQPETVGSPACTPNALTVGAVDKFSRVADFSSIGPVSVSPNKGDFMNIKPDVVAPGVDIVAARAKDFEYSGPNHGTRAELDASLQKKYTYKSGTSMATPMVSGACALILQAAKEYLSITDPDVWDRIKAQPIVNNKNLAQLIKQAITDTAKRLAVKAEYEVNPYKSVESGNGLIQVKESIDYLLNVLLPPPEFFGRSPLSKPVTSLEESKIELKNKKSQPIELETIPFNGLDSIQIILQRLMDEQEITIGDMDRTMNSLQQKPSLDPKLVIDIINQFQSGSLTYNQIQTENTGNPPLSNMMTTAIKAIPSPLGAELLYHIKKYVIQNSPIKRLA